MDGRIVNSVRYIVDAAGRLIGYRNPVTDTDELLDAAAIQALVSNAGNVLSTVTVGGDSFTARTHQAFIPSSCTVTDGVATATVAAHGLATGALINVTGAASEAVNVVRAPITRLDANTIQWATPGAPAGSVATGVAAFQLTAWSQPTLEGIFPYMQRLSGKAFSLLQNAGMSGYKSADYLARYAVALLNYVSSIYAHWGYFNDCQYGITVSASCANVQSILTQRKAAGARCFLVSALPVPSGVWSWPVLSAPLTTMTDATAAAWISNWNRTMRDWCAANAVEFVDVHSPSVDVATGYALAGVCKASDIHPSQKSNYLAAKLIMARLASTSYRPALLATNALDNVAADATNRNLCRAAPVAQGAGGTPGAGETTAYTAWVTATAVAASRWRTNAGNLYYTAAGGTTGATPPTHTSGTVTDGTVLWTYAGPAVGTAGVPASWRVISGATCPTFVALVDKTRSDGTAYKALRCTALPTVNNDQLSITYVATLADIVAGDTLNFSMLASVRSNLAAASATLGGQNLKSLTAQHDYVIDGVSYLLTEATGGVGAANEMQADDYIDATFGVEPIAVPPGASITQARYTLTALWSGAGLIQFDVALTTLAH